MHKIPYLVRTYIYVHLVEVLVVIQVDILTYVHRTCGCAAKHTATTREVLLELF